MSATNPENGTVTYTYDGAHHVLTRTDAKGQGTGYTYDAYGRLTAVAHYPQGFANGADTNQQITYYYDTNPYGDPIANYTWGRLAAVAFGNACGSSGAGYIYMYGYNPAGRVTGQKMRVSVNNTFPGSSTCGTYTGTDQTATYGWDSEGRMTSLTYPGSTNVLAYTYDAMGHLAGMTDPITSATTASATYGTAGEIDSLVYGGLNGGFGQTFTYNSLWQLTGDGTTQYVYPAGQNNGRISQSFDGVQTVNYTYDSLNRLATAQATDGTWGQAYSYDGFGNLTAKTVTAGSAMHFSASYSPATNNGGGTDANGNVLAGPLDPATGNWVTYTYDVENRIITSCEPSGGICNGIYGYDPQGKRVLRQTALAAPTGNWALNWEFTFYEITGQRLSTSEWQDRICYQPTLADLHSREYQNRWGSKSGARRLATIHFAPKRGEVVQGCGGRGGRYTMTQTVKAAVALVLAGAAAWAQNGQQGVPENAVTRVSEHVYAIVGYPNIAIVTGRRATLVVDTGMGQRNGAVVAREAQKLAHSAQLYLTTTHFHPEHATGEQAFPPNTLLIRPAAQQEEMEKRSAEYIERYSKLSPQSNELLKDVKLRKPDIVFEREAKLDLGGATARLLWMGPAHTIGDELIFVDEDKTLISGDIVQNKMIPSIPNADSSVTNWLAILDKLAPLKPRFVVPDHGPLGDGSLIAQQKSFLSAFQARVRELDRQGTRIDRAVEVMTAELRSKYKDWENLTTVPNLVRRIYEEGE